MRKGLLTLIVTIVLSFYGFSQGKPISTNAQQSTNTERDIQELTARLDKAEKKIVELSATVEEYESFYKHWQWVLGVFSIVSLGSWGFSVFLKYIYIPKKIIEEVNKLIDASLKKTFNDRYDDFLSLLRGYDFDKKIKEKYKLIAITHPDDSETYHYKLLIKNGFSVTAYTNTGILKELPVATEEVIIINDEAGRWPKEEVEQFINTNENFCFYIGPKRIDPISSASNRFAASNIRTQFIGNLMNMLKYQ